MKFMSELWDIPTLSRIGNGSEPGSVPDLWVLFRNARPADLERAILAEREYRGAARDRVAEIHFHDLAEFDEDALPPLLTVFAR
jgi:hypothetical protein